MFINYLKISFRNILRNKVFSIINIGGLSLALASTFFILVYVVNELSYDECHEKRDRIYRINTNNQRFNLKRPATPFVLGTIQKDEYSEIGEIARIRRFRNIQIKLDDNFINENNFQLTDPSIFDIFTLPLISGSNDISDLHSIVISENIASKYFGKIDPINEYLDADILGETIAFKIVGIMKNIPQNSTFDADIIGNIELSLNQFDNHRDHRTSWYSTYWFTYILLNEGINEKDAQKIFDNLEKKSTSEFQLSFELQSLTDVYLFSDHLVPGSKGSLRNIYLFIIIGFSILLISSSNYIILSSALSSNRTKEIGIRKLIGASKKNIVLQVLAETSLTIFSSMILSIVLIDFLQPFAQDLFEYDFNLLSSNTIKYLISFSITLFIVGFVASMYLAFYLTSLSIVDVLKSKLLIAKKGKIRKLLIVFQLSVFTILLFSVLIVNQQYEFMLSTNYGINKENIIIVKFNNDKFTSCVPFHNKIKSNSNIINASLATFAPPSNSRMAFPMNRVDDPKAEVIVEGLAGDFNFIETLGLKIVKGRSLSEKFADDQNTVVMNETAIAALGIEDPIGKQIDRITIVGVIKDFNLHSLHSEIPPLTIGFGKEKYYSTIIVKYKEGTYKQTKEFLQAEWKKLTDTPFYSQTFEEANAELYSDEKRLINIITFYTILSILLSASGIFGLTIFTMKKRTKEIGVRKVLGASVFQIFSYLNKEFVLLIILSNVIGLPIAYYFMEDWLENFAYRINIGLIPFVISIAILLVIITTTISIQTTKAALSNPVNSLRDE